MKILLFSSLFPSSARPVFGIFVETRLRELLKMEGVAARVLAPVPWFPSSAARFGSYAQLAATPRMEHRNGLEVHHPRYALVPRIGMHMAPHAMALAALPVVRRLQRDGFDFKLIDAHYVYPDGVAAALLSRWIRKPFVVTARGSDVNLIATFPLARRRIAATLRAASASIGVSQALTERLIELGAPAERALTLRNGVDTDRFAPVPRETARLRLGLDRDRHLILMVGNLVELKGHAVVIEALTQLPDANLVCVGAGPEQGGLQDLAQRLGVASRVNFVGQVAQADLKWWYSAANVLALCSSREGWPNVLLESMACGTPVIATRVSGTGEMVTAPAAGVLMEQRDAASFVSAWHALNAALPARAATRDHATRFSWAATSQGQFDLFRRLM